MSILGNSFIKKALYGGGIFFDLCKWVIFLTIILILIHKFWMTVFIVDGVSMDTTIHDGELIILERYYRENDLPARGDIVAVRYPGDPENKKYIKRVVGMPGEKVEVKDGKVYVQDNELAEKYIPFDVITEPAGVWDLENDEYFLMGDNRPNSNDSRYFGAVEKRFILGKAVTIIYPRLINTSKL